MHALKIYFIFVSYLVTSTIIPMDQPLSLKIQCIKAIGAQQDKIPQLREQILNCLPSELQLLLIPYLYDYEFTLQYATEYDINQDIADLIVENTIDLIQKIINDPCLKSIFPKRMRKGENNTYLAWALCRQFIENQVRKNEYEKHDRESACLQHITSQNVYYCQSIEDVLKEKLPEEWHEGITYFLQRVKKQNNGKKICDMVLSNESNEPIAFFKNYSASFEGDAFFNENSKLLLLAGNKRGLRHLVIAENGLQIFAFNNLGNPLEGLLHRIVTAYFSNNEPNKILIETEAGNTFEFKIPLKAYGFIKNITPESVAALLIHQYLAKLVINFANSRYFSQEEYDFLNEKIVKMLSIDTVITNEFLYGKYNAMKRCLDFSHSELPREVIGLGKLNYIERGALGAIVIAFLLVWLHGNQGFIFLSH